MTAVRYPSRTFKLLRNELKLYDLNLFKKDYLIVINKADLFPDKTVLYIAKKSFKKKAANPVIVISAVSGEGLDNLLKQSMKKLL